MDSRDILVRPIVTEKTNQLMAEGKYTFRVPLGANKVQIKKAVEEIFKVKVAAVNTARMHGKFRRQGRTSGYQPDWKKAVVTLRPGEKIQLIEGV